MNTFYTFGVASSVTEESISDKLTLDQVPFTFSRLSVQYEYEIKENEKKKIAKTCSIPDFMFGAFSLRQGYIYLYYEKKEGIVQKQGAFFEEYYVQSSKGEDYYQKIKWKPKDQNSNTFSRKEKEESLTEIQLLKGDVVWVAYSEIQWSADHVRKVLKDQSQIENRFQKIDVNQWLEKFPKDKKHETKLHAVEDKDNPNYYCYWSTNNIGGRLVYTLPLIDAFDMANTIHDVLCDKIKEFEAFILSLGSSSSKEELLGEVEEESKAEKDVSLDLNYKPSTYYGGEQQYVALFQSALILRQLFFSKQAELDAKMVLDSKKQEMQDAEENEKERDTDNDLKKYRKKIDKVKLASILGDEERVLLKQEIERIINSLGTLLFSNLFQNVLVEYYYSSDFVISLTRVRILLFLQKLNINIHEKDTFLEEHYDPKKYTNKWADNISLCATETIASPRSKQLTYKLPTAQYWQNNVRELLSTTIIIPEGLENHESLFDGSAKMAAADKDTWAQAFNLAYSVFTAAELSASVFIQHSTGISKYNAPIDVNIEQLSQSVKHYGRIEKTHIDAKKYVDQKNLEGSRGNPSYLPDGNKKPLQKPTIDYVRTTKATDTIELNKNRDNRVTEYKFFRIK